MIPKILPKKVKVALKRHDFSLKRSGHHFVLVNPAGKTITLASTPSDFRAENNMLRDIKRVISRTPYVTDTPDAQDIRLPKQERREMARNGANGANGKQDGSGFIYTPAKRATTTEGQRENDKLRGLQDEVIARVRAEQRRWEQSAEDLMTRVFNAWKKKKGATWCRDDVVFGRSGCEKDMVSPTRRGTARDDYLSVRRVHPKNERKRYRRSGGLG
jgi:hypothetical protein